MSGIKDAILEVCKNVKERKPLTIVEDGKNEVVSLYFNNKSKSEIKQNLSDWSNRDFALYLFRTYYERFGEKLDWAFPGTVIYISNIKSLLKKIYNYCDNKMLKSYIDYYYDNWLMVNKNKNGEFYISQMKKDNALNGFHETYNKTTVENKKYSVTDYDECVDSIEECYLVADEQLVSTFGVVISLNWLIVKKNYSIEDAKKYIENAIKKLQKKKFYDKVLESTKKFTECPLWFAVRDTEYFNLIMGEKIEIKFVDGIKDFNNILGDNKKK